VCVRECAREGERGTSLRYKRPCSENTYYKCVCGSACVCVCVRGERKKKRERERERKNLSRSFVCVRVCM